MYRDSDKENNTETTPEVEKKTLVVKEDNTKTPLIENIPTQPVAKDEVKVLKQPLAEIKKSPEFLKNTAKDEAEVQLRRSLNNNVFLGKFFNKFSQFHFKVNNVILSHSANGQFNHVQNGCVRFPHEKAGVAEGKTKN